MLWKIILSSKESWSKFLHREIMEIMENGRATPFLLKNLEGEEPPQ